MMYSTSKISTCFHIFSVMLKKKITWGVKAPFRVLHSFFTFFLTQPVQKSKTFFFKVSRSAVRTAVSQSLSKYQSLWLLAQFPFFTFNVGTLIITLSYVEVGCLTHFSVKRRFFTPLRRESVKYYFEPTCSTPKLDPLYSVIHTYIECIYRW